MGTGFIGPAHIEALRRLGCVDVVATAHSSEPAAEEKGKKLYVEKSFGDYSRILDDPSIQVVHVCTPNNLHYTMCKEALQAGKHVICEKPLSLTVREGKELVDLAEKAKRVNAVQFNLRYYPLVQQIRSMVIAGELGRIFAVQGSYLQDWLFFANDYNWRLEKEQSGQSRAVSDIGSHWLDMAQFVTNSKITRVFSDFATFYPVRKKPRRPVETYAGKMLQEDEYQETSIETEDYASLLLEFDNGAKGSLTVNQVAAGRKNRLLIEIYGSKKSVAWDSERPNELWVGRRDGRNEIILKDPSLVSPDVRPLVDLPGGHNEGYHDTLKQMFKEVYGFILREGANRGNLPTFPTFWDGYHELQIIDAVVRSARHKQWVDVGVPETRGSMS